MKFRFCMKCVIAVLLACVLCQSSAAGPVRKKIAIRAGKIITISGNEIKNGVIMIEDGKIKSVGTNLEIPWDAFVIEADDKVVMPGFVLAHTYQGLESSNESIAEVPFLSTFDSIDPLRPFFADSLRDGIVAMCILPGNNTLLGGTGTIVKPYGRTLEAMLIKNYSGLKISMRPTRNTSRMGHMQRFRKYMTDLNNYTEQYNLRKSDAQEQKKPFTEEFDVRKKPMLDILDKKLRAFIYCERASDVLKAIEIHDQYKLDSVLVLSPDCYKAAAFIAKKKLPVILDSQMITYETDELTDAEQMKVLPKIFYKSGVKFAYQVDSSQFGSRYLWHQAMTAVKHGVKRSEALKAATLYPAQMIGVGDRLGSIEPGKDASLLFLTGDPLDAQTWVDQVMLEGEIVYERSKDVRLEKLLDKNEDEQETR